MESITRVLAQITNFKSYMAEYNIITERLKAQQEAVSLISQRVYNNVKDIQKVLEDAEAKAKAS